MRTLPAVFAVAVLAFAGSAAGAPTSDALIRPGRSIAGAQLGMTEAQLRRVLGKPLAVVTKSAGFGRVAAELQYADYNLFVFLRGRRGDLRVVKVVTLQTSERTREGVGVGTRLRVLTSHYRGRLTCAKPLTWRHPRSGRIFVEGQRCTIPSRGARTVFRLDGEVETNDYWGDRSPYLSEWARYARVVEITVETLS